MSYGLAPWTDEQRELLQVMLDGRGIPYEIEDDELTVLTAHETDVDRMLDSLGERGPRDRADVFTVLRRVATATAAAVALWLLVPVFTTPTTFFFGTDRCGITIVDVFGDDRVDDLFDEGDEDFEIDGQALQDGIPSCRDGARDQVVRSAVGILATGAALVVALRVLREDGPF